MAYELAAAVFVVAVLAWLYAEFASVNAPFAYEDAADIFEFCVASIPVCKVNCVFA